MKMPIIIISYGDFSVTRKLFSYQEFKITKIPIFTSPLTAALFVNSISKNQLKIQICDNAKSATDIFELIGMLHPTMMVQINPRPWSIEAMSKLESSREMEETRVITIAELVDEIQSSNGS